MATERESVELVGDELVGNIARAALSVALTGASGYVSFPSPVSPTPVTMQVLVIFLAGILLDPVWGGGSVTFYPAAGGLGAPVSVGGPAGLAPFVGPAASYPWSYPVVAVIVGLVVHGGINTGDYCVSTPRLVGVVVAGTVVVYASDTLDFTYIGRIGLESAFWTASAAFIPAEAFKIAAAVGIVRSDTIAAQQTIRVEGPVHRYGDTITISRVGLAIDDGECVVVVGVNGPGKVTFVRHSNGLLDPDEGTMSVNGRTVSDHPVTARTAMAMVFRHPEDQPVATTVGADVTFGLENLDLDRGDIDHHVRGSLAMVNLDGRKDERVDSLSSGEVEQLAITGALAMRPNHLILDEPFTGLNEPTQRSVFTRLRDLRAGGTSLIVVARGLCDVAELADHVVVLADGDIALDTVPNEAAGRLLDLDVRPPC